MEYTALQISQLLNGTVEGNPEVTVSRISKIEEGQEGSISFLANPKYTPYIYSSKASIIIVNKDFIPEKLLTPVLIRVENAYSSFALLLDHYSKTVQQKNGISGEAHIDTSARIADHCYIGEFVFIGANVIIGENSKVYPFTYVGDNTVIGENNILYQHVILYHDTVIGNNCIFHSGVVIGSDGFGFAPGKDGSYKKVPQTGNVIIEDDVEIGANTTIDRATIGSTIIRRGVKLDNHIQVAHNVEIGENTGIAAQTGIAGSTKIGKNCMIGGQVGITGHLIIGDNVMIGAKSGVITNIKDGSKMIGGPVVDAMQYKKQVIVIRKLPELYRRIEALLNKLERNK